MYNSTINVFSSSYNEQIMNLSYTSKSKLNTSLQIDLDPELIYNLDIAIDLCIILCAQEFWMRAGQSLYTGYKSVIDRKSKFKDENTIMCKSKYKVLKKIKKALKTFEDLSYHEISNMSVSHDEKIAKKYRDALTTLYVYKSSYWF